MKTAGAFSQITSTSGGHRLPEGYGTPPITIIGHRMRATRRADSAVPAGFGRAKDGNLRVVYAGIGPCQERPVWRGTQAAVVRPYPAVTCHVGGERGPLFSSSHQRVGHRYTSRTAPAEPEVVTGALGGCARWPIGRARRVTKPLRSPTYAQSGCRRARRYAFRSVGRTACTDKSSLAAVARPGLCKSEKPADEQIRELEI
jgi:hypothetical protein